MISVTNNSIDCFFKWLLSAQGAYNHLVININIKPHVKPIRLFKFQTISISYLIKSYYIKMGACGVAAIHKMFITHKIVTNFFFF